MAKNNNNSSAKRPSFEEIAALAYQMYEQEGRPHGRHDEHWTQAELLLMTRHLQPGADKNRKKS